MRELNYVFTLLILLLLTVASVSVNAQNVKENFQGKPAIVHNSVSSEIGNEPQIQVPQNTKLTSKIREIAKKLDQARDGNNKKLIHDLEYQLNTLSGSKAAIPGIGPQATPLRESYNQPGSDDPRSINMITTGGIWATATTTQNTDGKIWVATTHYSSTDTDTLKIFYSTDGGITWTYLNGFSYSGFPTVNFMDDDLDIEVLNDGTNWYIYVTGGYTYNNQDWGFVARYKDDGSSFFYENTPKSSGTNEYWTRVVSDYPRYTSNAYVYIVATMDSTIDASTKEAFTRAFVIENPYDATPTVTDRNHNPSAPSSYWWHYVSAPIGAFTRSDVAYYDSLTAGSRLVTSTIFENTPYDSVTYMTYSDNYMATTPYISNNISLTYKSTRPIMSFSGGNDQLKGCIASTWTWEDTLDSDPRYLATTDGGGTWMQGFIESSYDTTFKADVIGLRGVDGAFKFGWINTYYSGNNSFYYASGQINPFLDITNTVMMNDNNIYPDDYYGGRAGYKLNGTDSCFAVFEGPNGSNAYAVSGCEEPTSVTDNQVIPTNYSVDQNYPNPFNPSTKIRFGLPSKSNVSLIIYDILGREVTKLVNGILDAGSHTVQFNAAGLSSGIYFYRLEARNLTSSKSDFIAVKKMALLK